MAFHLFGTRHTHTHTRASYIKNVWMLNENMAIYWCFLCVFAVLLCDVTQSSINLSSNINKRKHAVENGCDLNIQKVANIKPMSLIGDISRMLILSHSLYLSLSLPMRWTTNLFIYFRSVFGHLWLRHRPDIDIVDNKFKNDFQIKFSSFVTIMINPRINTHICESIEVANFGDSQNWSWTSNVGFRWLFGSGAFSILCQCQCLLSVGCGAPQPNRTFREFCLNTLEVEF